MKGHPVVHLEIGVTEVRRHASSLPSCSVWEISGATRRR